MPFSSSKVLFILIVLIIFKIISNFAKTTNEDGSTTYTLQGKDIEGNDFSTDASFTLLKDIFIESAALIDDGRTLQVIMNNGDIITIDLSKLF